MMVRLGGFNNIFQLNNLIKDSLTSKFDQFGTETIYGKVNDIKTETDLIGAIDDDSNKNTLFGRIAALSSGGAVSPECNAAINTRILTIFLFSIDPETDLSITPITATHFYNYTRNIDWTSFCSSL